MSMIAPESDPLIIRERLTELFRHPNLLPENLLSFLVDYLAVNMPEIPIGHIIGSSAANASGTSFPASPANDDEYVYVADGTNGVYWRFKYRSATSKWVFVGGAPLFSQVATEESTSSATYAALATAGPSITLPFAGDYDVGIGCYGASGNNGGHMSYDIGGTGAVDADAAAVYANATQYISVMRYQRKTGLTAVTLTAKYRTLNTGITVSKRWMTVTPVQTA